MLILEEKVILDVIPIYIGEMYPTSKETWHFSNDGLKNGVKKEKIVFLWIEHVLSPIDKSIFLRNLILFLI